MSRKSQSNIDSIKQFIMNNKVISVCGAIIAILVITIGAILITRAAKSANIELGSTSPDGSDTLVENDTTTGSDSDISDNDDPNAIWEVNSELPYAIKVNRVMNCVTVYKNTGDNKTFKAYKAFACSTAKDADNTPLGTFNTTNWYPWCRMVDNTYSQYAYRIHGSIMFHAVPCFSKSKSDIEFLEFNKLGSPASLGCVRLTIADAKWICDNCPEGTTVMIYDDTASPGPLGKPEVIKIPTDSPNRTWDPTDPDEKNPWKKCSASFIVNNTIEVAKGSSDSDIISKLFALDTCGNDISDDVKISGDYDLSKNGEYSITLKVTDLLNSTAEKTITLVVKDKKDIKEVGKYTIKYYTGSVDDDNVVGTIRKIGNVGTKITADSSANCPTGYTKPGTVNGSLTISGDASQLITVVYAKIPVPTYSYTIKYYKDSVSDANILSTITATAEKGTYIAVDLTKGCPNGYVSTGEVVSGSVTLSVNNQVINVVYKKSEEETTTEKPSETTTEKPSETPSTEFNYTINYYKGSVSQTNKIDDATVTGKVKSGSTITIDDTRGCPEGYISPGALDDTSKSTITYDGQIINITSDGQIINVIYKVKPE